MIYKKKHKGNFDFRIIAGSTVSLSNIKLESMFKNMKT